MIKITDEFKELLESKLVNVKEKKAGQFSAYCPFGPCDDSTTGNKSPAFGFNYSEGYNCFQCEAKGSISKLAKHLGIDTKQFNSSTRTKSFEKLRDEYHQNIPKAIRNWLHKRMIDDDSIRKYKLGWDISRNELTLPIGRDFKRRENPLAPSTGTKYRNNQPVSLFGVEKIVRDCPIKVFITGGELDAISTSRFLEPYGFTVICSTGGEQHFSPEWIQLLGDSGAKLIMVALDNDDTGVKASDNLCSRLVESLPDVAVYQVTLPNEIDGVKVKDMTNYWQAVKHTEKNYTKVCTPSGVYVSKFSDRDYVRLEDLKPMSLSELSNILGILYEPLNSVIVFLGLLSIYTGGHTINTAIIGGASGGKSHIANAIVSYFPKQDVRAYSDATPRSLIYLPGEVDDSGMQIIDMENKIIYLRDVRDDTVAHFIRTLLSKDEKLFIRIGTNSTSSGYSSPTRAIKGFIAWLSCSVNMVFSDETAARMTIISPSSSADKNLTAMDDIADKMSDELNRTKTDSQKLLADRLLYIKDMKIASFYMPKELRLKIKNKFVSIYGSPTGDRIKRDFTRIIEYIFAYTALNAPWRQDSDNLHKLIVREEDALELLEFFTPMIKLQGSSIAPAAVEFFDNYLLPAMQEPEYINRGMTLEEILGYYSFKTGDTYSLNYLKYTILSVLVRSQYLTKEQLEENKKYWVYKLNPSHKKKSTAVLDKKNSLSDSKAGDDYDDNDGSTISNDLGGPEFDF